MLLNILVGTGGKEEKRGKNGRQMATKREKRYSDDKENVTWAHPLNEAPNQWRLRDLWQLRDRAQERLLRGNVSFSI